MEEAGVTVFTGFAGSELLLDGTRVAGVRTDDKGIDKEGKRKSNFEPGYDLQAKVVILAEGSRGSLTQAVAHQLPALFEEQSADLWPGHKRAVGGARGTHRPW